MNSKTKAQKAKALRYKKPIVRDMNLCTIKEELWEMIDTCDQVRYFIECDTDETLLDAMLGDEEEVTEFKWMFADLSAECERFSEDLDDWEWSDYIDRYYDLFMVNGHIHNDFGGLLGYDQSEGDYFGLDSTYESDMAEKEAGKKLMHDLTKEKMLDLFGRCMRLFTQYLGIRYRYDCLEASMAILRDQNAARFKMVKRINELYEKVDEETRGFEFCFASKEAYQELDNLIEAMPQEAFL